MATQPTTATSPPTTATRPFADKLTPAMRQYVEQKKKVGDALLLFRMGDFYETFYDDAVLCAKTLGITLTSRDKNSTNPIPLAGIPHHALDGYLKKLVDAGHKVAISEQLEDPKQAKGVVKRDVVRIVTSGTLTDESLLCDRDDNTLASLVISGDTAGLALVELSSGRMATVDVTADTAFDTLARARPAELLIDDERGSQQENLAERLRDACATATTRRPAHEFSSYQAEQTLLRHFRVTTLAGFGYERVDGGLRAAGAILAYLQETQKTALSHITSVTRRVNAEYLQIDHNSWCALEIERTIRGGNRAGTLLSAVDRTVHPIGARLLRQWLRWPLLNTDRIVARQDAVQYFTERDTQRESLRRCMKNMADIERIASRVALGRTNPRDLKGLGNALDALPDLQHAARESRVALLMASADDLGGLQDIAELLRAAIRDDPPMGLREGGFIADGHHEELDRLRNVRTHGQQWLADYQRREIERSGIANLKVGFNRVFGYYIEVSRGMADRVPADYVRRQTVKNAERYITDELKKHEHDVLTAEERANELEYRLFEQLRQEVATRAPQLLRVAGAIGQLDCVAGLAELAIERHYARPHIVDGRALDVADGRHPVLEQSLPESFVPNDCTMNTPDDLLFVITGPNMAGKSTYIRQVALLALLAQAGSFVPARSMRWSIVDRIFARVGSADEIMRGMSTFMVEMTEAANILHHATKKSLVVLDELGRGTSTFDGLSLAWAIAEHLARNTGCRTLVATHYHEMTALSGLIQGIRNYNVAVRELPDSKQGEGGIAFLHKIVEGPANKSYGIHVARLAGIPPQVIARSREVLAELQRGFQAEAESPSLTKQSNREPDQLQLFPTEGPEPQPDPRFELLLDELRRADPNRMTPLQALQKINDWKQEYSDGS